MPARQRRRAGAVDVGDGEQLVSRQLPVVRVDFDRFHRQLHVTGAKTTRQRHLPVWIRVMAKDELIPCDFWVDTNVT